MKRNQSTFTNIILYVLLTAGAAIVLFPFFWMLTTSVKPLLEAMAFPPRVLPQEPTVRNFAAVFDRVPFLRYMLNSIFVATTTTVSTLFFCSLAGYVFAKHRFPGRDLIFLGVLAKLMIPHQVQLVPLYMITLRLGQIDSLIGVVLPGLMGAFGIFFMRQFFYGIPDSLLEAGRIDGLNEFGLFSRIAVPLSIPALSTLAIITYLYAWDDFLWPLIVINSRHLQTLPLGLAVFERQFFANYGMTMAASTMAIAPMLLLFFILQRQIIESLAFSGIKQ